MSKHESNDAIAMLKADHRAVETLFEDFETAEGKAKQAIADKICAELKIHTSIEEEIFYPALKGKVEKDDLDEAFVEHDAAKVMINEILASGPNDEFYDAKVKVLSEEITHHVKEEEETGTGLFAKARAAGIDLDALGDAMQARKAELAEQAESTGLPEAKLTALQHT